MKNFSDNKTEELNEADVDFIQLMQKNKHIKLLADEDAGASVNSIKNFQMPTMYANIPVGYTNTTGSMRLIVLYNKHCR